ncbi:MAG: carbon-nitrogen hydrolase family protein [Defluviitaleaceae bacterium]|nr:carbon-nitrogen hydrolase family protein [Defluviitaleaceae bacterium]
MKIGVAVFEVKARNIAANTNAVLACMREAAAAGVDLLLLPEVVLTGFVFDDVYAKDLPYALELKNPLISRICEDAKRHGIGVAFGFIENGAGTLYDSAILVNSDGEIVLQQRRLTRGWCAPNANPAEYGTGTELCTAMTPWGNVGFMICGDLFDAVQHAADAALDILLFPYARCFAGGVTDAQAEWDNVEWPEHAAQIKKANAGITLGANYISTGESDEYFGGGFVAARDGARLAALPLYTPGLLVYEVPTCK